MIVAELQLRLIDLQCGAFSLMNLLDWEQKHVPLGGAGGAAEGTTALQQEVHGGTEASCSLARTRRRSLLLRISSLPPTTA